MQRAPCHRNPRRPSGACVRLAYIVNQYPTVSHTFIRREIQELERIGVTVHRFAIRRFSDRLVDPTDRDELARTRFVIEAGARRLLLAQLYVLLTAPVRTARAVFAALRCGWRSDRGLLRHLVYVGEAALLLRWLRQEGVEHVHAHFGTNSAAVAMLCRLLGGPPYSFTAHGIDFDDPKALSIPEKVSRARFVVAVSDSGRRELQRVSSPEDRDKVRLIRCGLPAEILAGPTITPPSDRRLVFVGRLAPEKAPALLIGAVAQLAREGRELELVLVGDGPLRGQVEREVERYGIAKQVHLTGWRDGAEVRTELRRARALVLPSLREGLPTAILEAYAAGRPVIASDVGGIGELVETGATGWLVPPGAIAPLIAAMREALEASPDLLHLMAAAGLERVRQRHDGARAAASLAVLFAGDETTNSVRPCRGAT